MLHVPPEMKSVVVHPRQSQYLFHPCRVVFMMVNVSIQQTKRKHVTCTWGRLRALSFLIYAVPLHVNEGQEHVFHSIVLLPVKRDYQGFGVVILRRYAVKHWRLRL